jgi:hypothetical protein
MMPVLGVLGEMGVNSRRGAYLVFFSPSLPLISYFQLYFLSLFFLRALPSTPFRLS